MFRFILIVSCIFVTSFSILSTRIASGFAVGNITQPIITKDFVVLRNDIPRRDINGDIIDAHDGSIEYFEGSYYLYGTSYGNTDGFAKFNQFVCYRSSDLANWTPLGEIISFPAPTVRYRPHVKFCPQSGKYVLWYNWYPVCCLDGRYGVATSHRPDGPFVEHTSRASLKRRESHGDFSLFVDDDGAGYIVYTADTDIRNAAHHRMYVEKLAPDYLAGTGETAGFRTTNVEAPAMFKRHGTYYVLFDNTCCFCRNGTGVRVYTSPFPLGPYVYRGNINRGGGKAAGQSSPDTKPATGRPDSIINAQQTQVAVIPTKQGIAFMWIGDQWKSAFDWVKGHDFQYWSPPLEFDSTGMIRPLKWHDTVLIKVRQEPATSVLGK